MFYLLYHFPQLRRIAAVITERLSSALSLTAWRWVRMEKTLHLVSAKKKKDELLSDPRVKGHLLQGVTTLFSALAANPQGAALTERCLYALVRKNNKRVNKPSKNPWLRQILKDQSGRVKEHKLIQESKTSFLKVFWKTKSFSRVSWLVVITGGAFLSLQLRVSSQGHKKVPIDSMQCFLIRLTSWLWMSFIHTAAEKRKASQGEGPL